MSASRQAKQAQFFLIGNPISGKKFLQQNWDKRVYPFLKTKLPAFDFGFTQKKGDATLLAKNALKKGYKTIVSMGGDGTLNEVVNGFFENNKNINPQASLGILPFGSGGDFIRTIKISRDYRVAWQNLLSEKTHLIDIGSIRFNKPQYQQKYFINIANIGVVAAIMHEVNASSRAVHPLLRYLLGSYQGYQKYHAISIELTLDQKPPLTIKRLSNLVIANGRFFGNGMCPSPQAQLDDGLFDVQVLKNTGVAKFFTAILPALYLGKNIFSSQTIESYRAQRVVVRLLDSSQIAYCEHDGETYGEGGAEFSILPQSLQLRY